jgi:peptide/nickel transport system permease protein
MGTYILRRILTTIPVLAGVLTLTFLLIHFIPGDPVDIMLGDQASTIDKEALRDELGLNQPLLKQYANFIGGVFKADLGRSLHDRRPVVDSLTERFPATLELTLAAIFLTLIIGIPLGVLAAVKQYSWLDNSVLVGGLLGMSLPNFLMGPLLIWVFAIQLDLLPVSERGGINHLVLPALSLAIALSAIVMRMTRASMLEVVKEDYINVARAKGLHPSKVYFKHALANALMPIITIVGLQFGALLTGTVITETIFDWPGIGTLLYSGIQQRNYPIVQGCVLLIAVIYVVVNLLTDLAYAAANPKVRLS